MNQINLDKLIQLAPASETQTAAVKLRLAQVYQGQLQQLAGGLMRLQLPTPQGQLKVDLPVATFPALQQLALSVQSHTVKSGARSDQSLQQPPQPPQKLPIQLQFQHASDGRIALSVQSTAAPLSVTLAASELRQLLLSVYASQTKATPVQSDSGNRNELLVTAQLQNHKNANAIQLPGLTALPVAGLAKNHLTALLNASHSKQLTIALQLSGTNNTIAANLLLPANLGQQSTGILDKTQQNALLQQLVKWFNQLQLSSGDTHRPGLNEVKQLFSNQPLSATPYLLQLQASGQQFQLQLIPVKQTMQLSVNAEDFNRPLQFVSGPQPQATTSVSSSGNTPLTLQMLQQGWRHLLPLLPYQPDPLASLPELPEPVQQILQLVRQSLPDGTKVYSANQLLQQLQSLLQFQPLQSNANVQTGAGALAVAIQLLLGHLLQKPLPAANQPANQKLAKLVSSLEPAQASSLLRQLAGHSSTLQQSQLATLESNTTTAQQLLLQLPLHQAEQAVVSQLQLEQREADGKQTTTKQTQWQLTMKFDLQQLGPLLVVAKLQQHQLQLQFYTEQLQAKLLADKFLPMLKERCSMQGLEISQADCMLGKIPESLLPRANSLLAIRV